MRADDVQLDRGRVRTQPPVDQVVEADGDPVRAQRRLTGSAGASCTTRTTVKAPSPSVLERRAQRVDAGRLEPLRRPGGQVAADWSPRARRAGRAARCCRTRARGSSCRSAVEELVLADPGDELLEHRRALGVGDAVEVDLTASRSRMSADDRVRRRQLVLPVGPGLLGVGEGRPGVRSKRRRLDLAERPTCRSRTTRSATGRPTSAW